MYLYSSRETRNKTQNTFCWRVPFMRFKTCSALRLREDQSPILDLSWPCQSHSPLKTSKRPPQLRSLKAHTIAIKNSNNDIWLEMVSVCSATTNQYKNLPTSSKACAHKAHVWIKFEMTEEFTWNLRWENKIDDLMDTLSYF